MDFSSYGFDFSEVIDRSVDERFDLGFETISIFAPQDEEKRTNCVPSGATEEELDALEEELITSLPREYLQFLVRWRYFIYYQAVGSTPGVFGIPGEGSVAQKPWVDEERIFLANTSGVSNTDFLVVLEEDVEGDVYHLEIWNDPEIDVDLEERPPTPYAPSFSLAFWRFCRERVLQMEQQKAASMAVKDTAGALAFELRFWDEEYSTYFTATVAGYGRPDVMDNLVGADEIVIPDEELTIVFSYPLSNEVSLTFTNTGGFSRKDVFRAIHEGYVQIYREEEEAVGHPGQVPGLVNRAQSEGPHGIWGHDMSDLFIEALQYDKATKTLSMFIGS